MWYLTAAVAFVGALCVVDLILSLGIIRRLREHTAELEKLTHGGGGPPGMTTMETGTAVGDFTATTTGGTIVRREQPDESQRLFAFMSPGCGACKDQLPGFIAYTAGFSGTVTVVIHTDEDSDDATTTYATRQLAGVAEVVIEPREGVLGKAFRVDGYPTWYLIDPEGMILASGFAIDRIAVPALR
jgi:hypothetical protein